MIPKALQALRRQAFRISNGSAALEGFKPTAADLAQQEMVIVGKLTFDESVALHIANAKAAENERRRLAQKGGDLGQLRG